MASWKPLLHTAVAGTLLGVGIYTAADVAGELTTFHILRTQALELAQSSDELKQQLGYPFTLGPWYNARIGFSAGRNVAQCSFQLQGQQQITDVTVRGIRRGGISNTLAYNVAGPGEWKLIDCSAMYPSGGGLVQPRSLMRMPEKRMEGGSTEAQQDQAQASGACSTCDMQQQQQQAKQQQQQQAPAPSAKPSDQQQRQQASEQQQQQASEQQQQQQQQRRPWWKPWQRQQSQA